MPDNHAPTEFIHYLQEVRRSPKPTEEASSFVASSMALVNKMERTLRQRIANGYNRLGAITDNMRGIHHGNQISAIAVLHVGHANYASGM